MASTTDYSYFLPWLSCLGPYCTTLKLLTTPWNTSLNGIWRMENLISMWGIRALWHLVLDAGLWIQHILHDTHLRSTGIIFPSICPGRYLSDSSLYSIVPCVLAVYDIRPPVDDQGAIIKLKPEVTSGLLS